jgi:hypothetical protein
VLSEAVQEKDVALSSARQEIEMLRAAIRDRDGALQALERTCGGLHDEIVGLQTHSKGKYWCCGLGVEARISANLVNCVQELEREQQVA